MESKNDLRRKFRNLRNATPGADDFRYLLDVPEVKKAEVITSYYPMSGEPSLITLNQELITVGKKVLLPRITENGMEFAELEGELVQRDKFHEPAGPAYVGKIDVVLVPATAIDKFGYRLGQGGGYYDRFLPTTSAFRIGIIHEREFIDSIPHEWFDEKVNSVATEHGFFRI